MVGIVFQERFGFDYNGEVRAMVFAKAAVYALLTFDHPGFAIRPEFKHLTGAKGHANAAAFAPVRIDEDFGQFFLFGHNHAKEHLAVEVLPEGTAGSRQEEAVLMHP